MGEAIVEGNDGRERGMGAERGGWGKEETGVREGQIENGMTRGGRDGEGAHETNETRRMRHEMRDGGLWDGK